MMDWWAIIVMWIFNIVIISGAYANRFVGGRSRSVAAFFVGAAAVNVIWAFSAMIFT